MEGKLDYKGFGSLLLETEDLDPVYTMIAGATLDSKTLFRWHLAYWCFYHTGVAARIAESPNYWEEMHKAYYEKWPRGVERRYFRGEKCLRAMEELESMASGEPERLVEHWGSGKTFDGVAERVKKAPLFGPWIAFKVADMAERTLGFDVDFNDCHLGIYRDPLQGAALIRHGDWKAPITVNELYDVISEMEDYFVPKFHAPPCFSRRVNIQEMETILCKYKSHFKGHYPPGKDTIEVRAMMEGWGDLAQELALHLPKGAKDED